MATITSETLKILQEKFPFLTTVTYINQQYIGIIQNSDNHFVSMYVLDPTFTTEMKMDFLKYGEIWWWESNRKIPINLFLSKEFSRFKPYLKTFAKKETTLVEGPVVNLLDLINRKLKKRTIQLVRGPD